MKPVATAWAFNFPQDIPIPQDNGCETLTSGKCPLKAGDNATYAFSMLISNDYDIYAGIYAEVEFALLDSNNETAICARVPITIKDSSSV